MKMISRFSILLLSLFLFFSCKEDKKAAIQFLLMSSNKTPNGRNYSIDASKTKILFSNFKLIDVSGNETLVKDVFLYKTGQDEFSFDVPEGNFTTFKFSYGLDTALNNSNPMSYPASHPLSVEEGLYWDMLKYRFSVIEASIDNSPAKNQAPNSPFSMHLGSDTLYTVVSSTIIPRNGQRIVVKLNMDRLFVLDTDPFMLSNFSNHSEPSEIGRAIAIKNSLINWIDIFISAPD